MLTEAKTITTGWDWTKTWLWRSDGAANHKCDQFCPSDPVWWRQRVSGAADSLRRDCGSRDQPVRHWLTVSFPVCSAGWRAHLGSVSRRQRVTKLKWKMKDKRNVRKAQMCGKWRAQIRTNLFQRLPVTCSASRLIDLLSFRINTIFFWSALNFI